MLATDKDGDISWKSVQESFGAVNALQHQSRINMNLRFPGQYYDQETGTHYNFHRDYKPNQGRYMQSDPIGLQGGVNTYGYVYQNPINNFDPDGRLVWFLGLGALGSVGTGTTVAVGSGAATGFWTTGALIGGAVAISTISGSTPQTSAETGAETEAKDSCDDVECDPVEGTRCYIGPDTNHPHGGLTSHYHIYQMFKVNKVCGWQSRGGKIGIGGFGTIPPGMMPCSMYSSFKGRRGGRGG